MHKGTMMGLCLMVALGAVLQEANASPDAKERPFTLALEKFLMGFYDSADIKKLREQCEQVTGDYDVIHDVRTAAVEGASCVTSTLKNMVQSFDTSIRQDLEYCKRVPDLRACVKEFYSKIQVCYSAKDMRFLEFILTIRSSLLEFACYQDGYQIPLLMDNLRPESLEANKDGIINCLDKYFPKDGHGAYLNSTVALHDSPTSCVDLQRTEWCILDHWETGPNITSVNMVQSVFEILLNETDCSANTTILCVPVAPKWIVAAGILGAAIFILILYLVFFK